MMWCLTLWSAVVIVCRVRSEPGGTRWRTGGEVKGKLANGVGSQYSNATSERGLSSITQTDAHTSAASSRLNWSPHRFKWTRPFRGKTKSGFCTCAITFRTSYTTSFAINKFYVLQGAFMCFIRISEQKTIIPIYSIGWISCYYREGVCLLRGTSWIINNPGRG